MRAYSFIELFYLTRTELLALHSRISAELPALPGSSPEYDTALNNLRRIRWVLAQPRPGP
ncbi:MAG TPA: hypothetical protein VG889_07125 [Rhizomicrobium sp.]|nr:hypothetical protein [Rhizomicrobium sp.]